VAFALRASDSFFLLPLVFGIAFMARFPPPIETLYIVKKSSEGQKDDRSIIDLLQASKDNHSGIYRVGESVAVKSYHKPFLGRYIAEFALTHDMRAYEVIHHSMSKKGYRDHYDLLLRLGYRPSGEVVEVRPRP
jgi:hypothetical protein